MMRRVWFVWTVALVAVTVAGCGQSRERRERAARLAAWIEHQQYSTWSLSWSRDGAGPASPDGLTLGSPNVFAAVGCSARDVTSLDVLWGDQRTARPLARPLTVGVVEGDRHRPLADFGEQTLRRVRHTGIAVSEADDGELRVRCVDFAPPGAHENYLARWFLVENRGRRRRQVNLRFTVRTAGAWQAAGRGLVRRDRIALVSDARLSASEDAAEVEIGRLRPGDKGEAAVLLVASEDRDKLTTEAERARAKLPDLAALLEATRTDWEEWCGQTPLRTGDARMDDLLDSLLCLVRAHIGPQAIHIGSLRYPHNRTWIRDSYWVQRALLELGRTAEARLGLEFMHRAWRTSGLASSYEIPTARATAWGYSRVELPHYLVLMVRDAEQFGAADGTEYWDMVRACLDQAAPGDGLQTMNGDETWLLAAPARELDDLLDNSWLLIASAEYGARLAERQGDAARAARYGQMAYRARLALREFMPSSSTNGWYALGRGGDGSLDYHLCPEVHARAAILGVLPADDPLLTAGLLAGWERLGFARGVRTHARSATISGGTPGYLLYAAADNPVCRSRFGRELARRAVRFASATGCVWEFHDLYDPAWGGEKRRLWDSAVLLMGLVHALFDAHREGNRVSFTPKPAPAEVLFQPPPSPPLDQQTARALLEGAGEALLWHQGCREHAARLARELLRHVNRQFAVRTYPGTPPEGQSAIIISPSAPGDGWEAAPAGYWVRQWDGPPQVWLINQGHVYKDTEPFLVDLLSLLPPEREQPLPFPDANLDLVARWGEAPAGEAELTIASGRTQRRDRLDLAGGRAAAPAVGGEIRVEASPGEGNLLKLSVVALAGRTEPVEIGVTFPPGWWLVVGRDMTGTWDRVEDRVREVHLPDGGLELSYSLRPGRQPFSLAFELARLRVKEL